jgi:hypothetical protein
MQLEKKPHLALFIEPWKNPDLLNLSCPHLLKLAFINLHISPITTQT